MCDAFLMLAQAPEGLSCFLIPRWRPDGEKNALHIQRLKPKLGNRSNASSEIEFAGAWARMVGEPGRGVATIIEMVRHTRLDCAFGGASLIRRAVAEALHFSAQRWTFGRRVVEQPLMQNVLADLCLESEAATALAFRLARSYDENDTVDGAAAFGRVATPVTKYWVTKRETTVVREALECFGGNGYVEEQPMARLFRESPLNSIWEGAGNVQCLDLLRALGREPAALDAFFGELELAADSSREFDSAISDLRAAFRDTATLEVRARRVVERMALALQASLLIRNAPTAVADAFVRSRIAGDSGGALGTLPHDVDFGAIIERSMPA
jgi:putative acyl-CoA dehydrogenase